MKTKVFIVLIFSLFFFGKISAAGNITYLTNDTVIATVNLEQHSIAYDPINEQYFVVWGPFAGLGGYGVDGQFIDKNGNVIGTPRTIVGGAIPPNIVYDNINHRYILMGRLQIWLPISGHFLDFNGNVISNFGGQDFGYRSRWAGAGFGAHNLVFNSATGRFLYRLLGFDPVYLVYDVDGNLYSTSTPYHWYYVVESQDAFKQLREISGNGDYLVTSPTGSFFMNDEGVVLRSVSTAYGERAIGYDESLAQFILLGEGYLINLNLDGAYIGAKRTIQGLSGYDNISLYDKAIAIDYERKRFLMVFDYTYISNGETFSSPLSIAIIDFEGQLLTNITNFPAMDVTAIAGIKVAYDNINNRYLLTWSENQQSIHAALIDGNVSSLPFTPPQSQGQGSGTNNQGTSNAPGLQIAPGLQRR